jgi:hypothetical protein
MFPSLLDVIAIKQPFAQTWSYALELMLSIRERQITQVFAITESRSNA